jgi:hypothetical protein
MCSVATFIDETHQLYSDVSPTRLQYLLASSPIGWIHEQLLNMQHILSLTHNHWALTAHN